MNSLFGSNIDDVRAEIMRLENEKVFDQRAWANVLGQLSNSPSRRQDAVRRMMTAKQNATAILEQPHWVVGVDAASGPDETVSVAVETISKDPLLESAKQISLAFGGVRVSVIQRKLSVGYTRASRLVDILIDEGFCEREYAEGTNPLLRRIKTEQKVVA